jgi:hypothetical protein
MQDSLETFLLNSFFKDKERRPKAVKIAVYMNEILGDK